MSTHTNANTNTDTIANNPVEDQVEDQEQDRCQKELYNLDVIKNELDQLRDALKEYIETPSHDWRESDTQDLANLCATTGNNFKRKVLEFDANRNLQNNEFENQSGDSVVKINAPQNFINELQTINQSLKELKSNILRSFQERERLQNLEE